MKSTIHSLLAATILLSVSVLPAQENSSHSKLIPFRWSGELNIPDPVAISLDDRGTAYVTQTQRRKSQDLDIRNNRDWIPFDVGFQSVDEKLKFYQQQLSIEAGQSAESKRRVQDMNEDSSHDYRDLRVLSERIHRIQDRDQDGTADSTEVFAENFQTEVTGIAAGVLAFNNSVYVTIAPDVWRLADTNSDGRADERQAVATGFGLHIAYAGHDMHGLTVGPDGRIYWTVGDKGISVVDENGRRWHYPNQGGVMRCNPDGSNFEVFAHGLRNVQELAFDQFGNLFGVDNDADQPGERERFVYIVQGMDAGWRCNYQYRGDGYNPWTAEGLWKTPFRGQPAYILPPLGYSLNGPAGFAFNPGTALSPDYENYFFLTGAPNGDQVAFRVEPKGAAFSQVDEHDIARGLPLVGINFGPDGALYAVDWGGGYPLNQKGAIWRFDVPEAKRDTRRPSVAELLSQPFSDESNDSLVSLLGHPDQRIRLKTQFELVRRRSSGELARVAQSGQNLLARIHAIWGLGQLVREGAANTDWIRAGLLSDEPQIKMQTCRLIRELDDFDASLITPLLASDDSHVVFHALMALAPHATAQEIPAVVDLLAEEAGNDHYLRHAATCVLENSQHLAPFFSHSSPNVRLALVVALRRRRDARLSSFLSDPDPLVVAEAVRAIHDDESILDSMDDLAALALNLNTLDSAIALRAINANLRLGSPEHANNLIQLASNPMTPLDWKIESLDALSDFLSPPLLDRVDGRNRRDPQPLMRRIPENASLEISALLMDKDIEVRKASLRTMRKLDLQVEPEFLKKLILDPKAPTGLRLEAISVYENQGSEEQLSVGTELFGDKAIEIRMAALSMVARKNEQAAVQKIRQILSTSAPTRERQNAVSILSRLKSGNARPVINELVQQLRASTLPQDVWVELLEVIETSEDPESFWLETVQAWKEAANENAELANIGEFLASQKGGNAEAGKKIFMTHVTAACIRCHQIGDRGYTVGPNLAGISEKKDPSYLLRSIVSPSADIDPNYQAYVVQLTSGETVQGLLKSNDGSTTTLFNSAGNEVKIPNDEIDEAGPRTQSIMPEMKTVLSKREIRDLVAYLQTL